MELSGTQRDFIDYARVCRLATADAAGQPHVVPVCPILVDGRVYVASEENRKVRNIRANPKVAMSFDDYVEDWSALRGMTVFGTVSRIIEGAPDFQALQQAFYAKFPQYEPQAGGVNEGGTVILEIEIERIADGLSGL
jgi:nitroimidazol reductase NimA-like FMN-containing flavoprotein (pyridoxamine 5'-phosphate oxidase superfamily)